MVDEKKKYERHYVLWKGTKNEYTALHNWVKRNKGEAFGCKMCGSIFKENKSKRKYFHGKYEWSNISGEYHKDIKDYESLCVSCHHKKDYRNEKSWEERLAWLRFY
jgi:hypothetical protein